MINSDECLPVLIDRLTIFGCSVARMELAEIAVVDAGKMISEKLLKKKYLKRIIQGYSNILGYYYSLISSLSQLLFLITHFNMKHCIVIMDIDEGIMNKLERNFSGAIKSKGFSKLINYDSE